MKTPFLLYFLVFLSCSTPQQASRSLEHSENQSEDDFEGLIDYEVTFRSKNPAYPSEKLEKVMGKQIKSYIKNGFYKEITTAEFMSYQLFRYQDNRIYSKDRLGSDTLFYSSTLEPYEGHFSYEVFPKADTVLNVVCDQLVVNDNYGTKTYSYSSQYALNPEFYKNYTISNKYEIVKMMKAVYLKLIIEYDHFAVEITATQIKRKKLDDEVFQLPEHSIMLKRK